MSNHEEYYDSLAVELKVKTRVLESDIKDMAWLWEELAEGIGNNPALLLNILGSLVKAYLRGRNIRMGNWQGICQHTKKRQTLKKMVIQYVASDECFENLHKAGVTSVEEFMHAARHPKQDIMKQVREILALS